MYEISDNNIIKKSISYFIYAVFSQNNIMKTHVITLYLIFPKKYSTNISRYHILNSHQLEITLYQITNDDMCCLCCIKNVLATI
jgi:hypothetical protein